MRIESSRSPERGKDVTIVLKFIRHGERDKQGSLTDYGRDVTRRRAQESGIHQTDFDAVKAIGSTAGPIGSRGMQRSLETAHIYAHEIAGDEAFVTRRREILSYDSLIHPAPYNHVEIYNANLPSNFDALSDSEKVVAAKRAQTAVLNHVMSLQSPEAQAYKRKVAGAFAYVILHYQRLSSRLKNGSRVLIPAGTHGGLMELLLQQALVWQDTMGVRRIGFSSLDEIGGDFDPSEAFNVEIVTDGQGKLGLLRVTFDDPRRPQTPMYLDLDRIEELSRYYAELHTLK